MHYDDSQYLENSGSTAGNIGFWKLLSFFLYLRVLDGVAELKCQVCGSIQSRKQGQSCQSVTVSTQAGAALSGLGTPQLLIGQLL